jgi:hypothetical protein
MPDLWLLAHLSPSTMPRCSDPLRRCRESGSEPMKGRRAEAEHRKSSTAPLRSSNDLASFVLAPSIICYFVGPRPHAAASEPHPPNPRSATSQISFLALVTSGLPFVLSIPPQLSSPHFTPTASLSLTTYSHSSAPFSPSLFYCHHISFSSTRI